MKCIRRIIKTIFIISEKLPAIGKIVKNIRINILNNYRIWLVQQSEDNIFIPRVENAGSIVGNYQIMHNGIKILKDGYYGDWVTRMFCQNRGVHEPQEERVFQEVLKKIPRGGCMVELGAYWSFYSLWFYKNIPEAKCYMVEPSSDNIKIGERNFEENSSKGIFINACIGNSNEFPGVRVATMDELMEEYQIKHLSILHSDIQGSEYEMIKQSSELLKENRIDYVFISTHTNEIHYKCLEYIKKYQYDIIAEYDVDKSFSWEGLIVANSKLVEHVDINNISINRRPRHILDWKDVGKTDWAMFKKFIKNG